MVFATAASRDVPREELTTSSKGLLAASTRPSGLCIANGLTSDQFDIQVRFLQGALRYAREEAPICNALDAVRL